MWMFGFVIVNGCRAVLKEVYEVFAIFIMEMLYHGNQNTSSYTSLSVLALTQVNCGTE